MTLKKEREELRQKTLEELQISLREAKKEMLGIRTNIATRKEEDNNRSKMLKRRIARILTVIGEKQVEAAAGTVAAGDAR
ncbi:MAG: 50S ribosomal protein L29 [candidate division Zixibacteria bacterium]|nr:50S ribosomal protein L29 [candidate division Zixibacteria bacterium]